nr:hypothetical protein [Tanacetum cinerariifolium]
MEEGDWSRRLSEEGDWSWRCLKEGDWLWRKVGSRGGHRRKVSSRRQRKVGSRRVHWKKAALRRGRHFCVTLTMMMVVVVDDDGLKMMMVVIVDDDGLKMMMVVVVDDDSGGKKETKAMVFHTMDTEEVSDRFVAPCFINGLEAYDGEISLGVEENMISNDYAVKLCLEHEVCGSQI